MRCGVSLSAAEVQLGNRDRSNPKTRASALLPHPDYQLAFKHHQGRRLAEAEAVYRRILTRQPSAQAFHGLGMVLADAGNLDGASRAFQQVLQLEPQFVDAWLNLGKVMLRGGNPTGATTAFRRAIALVPRSAETHNLLGYSLRTQGALAEAIESYRRAIELRPDSADQYNNLADALQSVGQFDDAIAAYRQALTLMPTFVEASYNLATALQDCGRTEEAIAAYRQTLQLAPSLPEAHNNLGNALSAMGRTEEAVSAYREAIRCRPNYADAFRNLGQALTANRRFDEAVTAAARAVELDPGSAETVHRLACAYDRAGKGSEALPVYRQALALRPIFPEAYFNLGWNHLQNAQLDEAMMAFNTALAQRPGYAEARFSRGVLLLSRGDFELGFPEYDEARWEVSRRDMSQGFTQPLWDGSDLAGKTVLLHAEQGLGDAIQFVRYVHLVKARGGRTVVRCWEPLKRLFEGQLGIEAVYTDKEPAPHLDTHYPLESLPRLLGTRVETIPANIPYLLPDPTLVDAWRAKLAVEERGLRVGLVWAGNPNHTLDRFRSTTLSTYAPLSTLPGLRLYSLQRGNGAEQAVNPPAGMTVNLVDDGISDLASTAALMQNLDLIITVDTAVAHLAGAIGKPVWLLLHLVPDWRWMLGRSDSPWYPTMRLFRQTKLQDWTAPIAAMTQTLRELTGG